MARTLKKVKTDTFSYCIGYKDGKNKNVVHILVPPKVGTNQDTNQDIVKEYQKGHKKPLLEIFLLVDVESLQKMLKIIKEF